MSDVDYKSHSLLDLSFSKKLLAMALWSNGHVTFCPSRYKKALETFIVPHFQQRQCLDSISFKHDGESPHIRRCVQQLLRQHFTNDGIISRAFPTIWHISLSVWFLAVRTLKKSSLFGNLGLVGLKGGISLHVRSFDSQLNKLSKKGTILSSIYCVLVKWMFTTFK